jgi:hypothetical protein
MAPNIRACCFLPQNGDCKLMDFYDGHDLWHFFSAAGIFMAFLALLTVDDDLLDVPRSDIEVF